MQRRKLGRSDLEVPVVCFGAWAIGGWNWGATDDEAAVRAIQVGIDCGMNAIDTAPVYGFGHSERVVARALQGRRDRAIVMTKVGLRWDEAFGDTFFETVDPQGKKLTVRRNATPASVRLEVERSLQRLGVEHLDLVQVHWPDLKTPISDTMWALTELRAQGKLREIGVSNFTVAMMKEAQRVLDEVPLASDQPKYNLVSREIERDVLPWLRQAQVGCLVYSPLEQGLLTGKVDAAREFGPDDGRSKRATFTPRNRALVNEVIVRVVRPIAETHSATVGQVVLAWTVAQPGITSALAGARTAEQARDNAAAGDLALTADEIARIRDAFESLKLDSPGGGGPRARIRRLVRRLIGK